MVRIKLSLVSNPKVASSKPFVAKIVGDNIEFVRPIIPEYARNGMLVGGEYEFETNCYYIIREDNSSHRHSVQSYKLVYFDGSELREIARITKYDRNIDFSAEELKEIYAKLKASGQNNLIVNTLIEYAKLHKARNSIDVEQLIRNEITAFVAELEKKYNVRITVDVKVEKR